MLRPRVIPTLLLRDESLVKTVRFGDFSYIGDPTNTVRIFNELEVDELMFLDISATPAGRGPNLELMAQIADECFMPLGYGGGISGVDQARQILGIGYEKVVVNTNAVADPELIGELARQFGSQAVIVSIDVRRDGRGRSSGWTHAGRQDTGLDPLQWAKEAERRGAGEILLTAIDLEGTWQGYDLALVRAVSDGISIPLIAHGGAASVEDVGRVLRAGRASAAAIGSMVVYQRKGMGVLVNFPARESLAQAIGT
jgi:cyclase